LNIGEGVLHLHIKKEANPLEIGIL